MKTLSPQSLSRRERQIMDIVHRLGRASAAEIHRDLPDAPHPAAVRTLLRILESKGHLRHEKDGNRHMYLAQEARHTAQKSALRHMLQTFFGGSRAAAFAALIDDADTPLSDGELQQVTQMIHKLRKEGR